MRAYFLISFWTLLLQNREPITQTFEVEILRKRMLSWRLQSVLVRPVMSYFVASTLLHLPTGVLMERQKQLGERDDELRVVQMGGAPPRITWIVQMSDIQISKWVLARGRALRKALGY